MRMRGDLLFFCFILLQYAVQADQNCGVVISSLQKGYYYNLAPLSNNGYTLNGDSSTTYYVNFCKNFGGYITDPVYQVVSHGYYAEYFHMAQLDGTRILEEGVGRIRIIYPAYIIQNFCSNGALRSSDIVLTCDPNVTGASFQPITQSPQCHYIFNASSAYACPIPLPESLSICMLGQYSATGNLPCSPCPAGSSTFFTSGTKCSQCPVGFTSVEGGPCTPCPAGTTTNGTGQTECINCPPGTSTMNITGSSCLACTTGTFAANPGQAMCDSCPTGWSSGNRATSCGPCPAGQSTRPGRPYCSYCDKLTYAPTPGSPCLPCPSGTVTPPVLGPTECTPCNPGDYASVKDNFCWGCAAGTFSNTSAAASCNKCPIGFTSRYESTSCTQCSPGTSTLYPGDSTCRYCGEGQISVPYVGCTACPNGTTVNSVSNTCDCPAGYSIIETSCVACPAGYYSATTNSPCTACPPNTFSPSAGQSTCQPCSPGMYAPHTGSIMCSQIPPNTPISTQSPTTPTQPPTQSPTKGPSAGTTSSTTGKGNDNKSTPSGENGMVSIVSSLLLVSTVLLAHF